MDGDDTSTVSLLLSADKPKAVVNDKARDNDSALPPDTPEEEWDRNSQEYSDTSSSVESSTATNIKDRLQKLKETLKLTLDQEREFQDCIDYVGELEKQNHTTGSTSSFISFSWAETSEWGTETEDHSSTKKVNTSQVPSRERETVGHPHEETRQPPSTEDVEIAQKWSEESLKKSVADVYHKYKSRERRELSDAMFSFLMVIEAICKVCTIAEPNTANCGTGTHVRWFKESFDDRRIPTADVLAKIRTAIAHCNFFLKGNNMTMYNRLSKQMKCTEIHTCTVDEFIKMSARVCDLFLSWHEISKYLPEEDKLEMAKEATGDCTSGELV